MRMGQVTEYCLMAFFACSVLFHIFYLRWLISISFGGNQ